MTLSDLLNIQIANVVLTTVNTALICANLYFTKKNYTLQKQLRERIAQLPTKIEVHGFAIVEEGPGEQKAKYDS